MENLEYPFDRYDKQIYLGADRDIAALVRTNRQLFHALSGDLYESILKRRNGYGLMWAAAMGREATVRRFLAVDSSKAYIDVLEFRVERSAYDSLNFYNEEKEDFRVPLCLAAFHGHDSVIKLLLEHGANPNTCDRRGRDALSVAAEHGYQIAVKLLLDHGAEVNHVDDYERSALSYAAEGGHDTVVRLLMDHKADVNTKDDGDRNALSLCDEKWPPSYR